MEIEVGCAAAAGISLGCSVGDSLAVGPIDVCERVVVECIFTCGCSVAAPVASRSGELLGIVAVCTIAPAEAVDGVACTAAEGAVVSDRADSDCPQLASTSDKVPTITPSKRWRSIRILL